MKKQWVLVSFLIINFAFILHLKGQDKYNIKPADSTIKCSVGYLALAKLHGEFKDFSGRIDYHPNDISKSSVFLKIKTSSIETRKPFLNRLIRSKRLLDAKTYPEITFKSKSVERKKDKYYIKGTLNLHGISKDVSFTFSVEEMPKNNPNRQGLKVTGSCFANRKDFRIIWSKLFDKGGLIVRNNVLIEWEIIGLDKAEIN